MKTAKKAEGKKKKWDIKLTKTDMDCGTLMDIFSRKGTRRSAIDLDKLMELSGLSERAAVRALKEIIDFGMKLAATSDNPPRYYWPKENRDKGKR